MHAPKYHTIGNYKMTINDKSIWIEATNPKAKLGLCRVNGIKYDNGNIAYDNPEWLPEYVKREVIKIMQ